MTTSTQQLKERLDAARPKSVDSEYTEGIGRRKQAIARVRLSKAPATTYNINGKALEEYFPVENDRFVVQGPFSKAETSETFYVSALVTGGGVSAQADAVRLGIARALVAIDPELRPTLKRAGFLERDDRQVERKKFGLKKARKAAQWSKR